MIERRSGKERRSFSDRRVPTDERVEFLFISRGDDVIVQHTCGILKALFETIGYKSKILSNIDVTDKDIIAAKYIILYRMSYLDSIKKLVKKYNKKIGFTIDDYLFGDESIQGISKESQNNMREAIIEADYCFCYTKNLAEKLKKYNKNVFIIPPPLLWNELFVKYDIPLPVPHNNPLPRIGLISGPSHEGTLNDRLMDIIISSGNSKIEVVYFASRDTSIIPPSNIKLERHDFIYTFKEFYTKLFKLKLDMLYVILPENNILVPYKTNLKYREAAFLKIPLVVVDPSGEMFKNDIINEVNGYNVKTRVEAVQALSKLIINKELRLNLGNNANLFYHKMNPKDIATHCYSLFCTNVKETTPKVSVVMSTLCRNHGNPNSLRRAIDSILNQTYKNFEFIITDDASSDGTEQVLKEYLMRDRRIRVFRFKTPCKGFTATRYNFAIKQAKGEIISYMFDDDVAKENHLQTIVDNMKDNDMIYTTPEWRQPNGDLYLQNFGGEWSEKILDHNYIANIGVAVRKTVFDRIGYHDESSTLRRLSDWEMWRRIYQHNMKVERIPINTAICYVGNKDALGVTIPVNINEVRRYIAQPKRQQRIIQDNEYVEVIT